MAELCRTDSRQPFSALCNRPLISNCSTVSNMHSLNQCYTPSHQTQGPSYCSPTRLFLRCARWCSCDYYFPTSVPQSSTARIGSPSAMAHTDPACISNVDPPFSTTHGDPPSSARPRHHVSFSVSGVRALLVHILPRFLQPQLNADQFTDPQQHSGQPVISIQAPTHAQVAAVPDNQVYLQLFFHDYC